MKFDRVEKMRENIKIRIFRYYVLFYCITLLYFFKLWKCARKHYLVIGERKVNNSVTKKNLICVAYLQGVRQGLKIKAIKEERRPWSATISTHKKLVLWKVWKTLTSSWKFDHVSISCCYYLDQQRALLFLGDSNRLFVNQLKMTLCYVMALNTAFDWTLQEITRKC